MGADESTRPDAHWWTLNTIGSVIAYDQIADDHGTFNGSMPNWIEGIFQGAVECNGVSDYFNIPTLDNEYSAYYTNTFSISGWFRTSQSTGKQTVIGNWNNYETAPSVYMYFGWQVLVENNKAVGRFGPASSSGITYDLTGSTTVNDDEWHHFTLVFGSQFDDSYLYVDGELDATPDTVHGILSNTKFRIGDASHVSSGNPTLKGGPFNGGIDEIMIFDRMLNADEVYQLYQNAYNPNID
jgi:hypothetical protein